MKTNHVSIFLESVCEEEVSKIIMYLKILALDGDFQPNVIKDTSDFLLLTLAHLLSLSITQGVFPDELKIAKGTPILKVVILHKLVTIDPAQYCLFSQKSLNVYHIMLCSMYVRLFFFIKNLIYYINISSVADTVSGTYRALVLYINKILKALTCSLLGVF